MVKVKKHTRSYVPVLPEFRGLTAESDISKNLAARAMVDAFNHNGIKAGKQYSQSLIDRLVKYKYLKPRSSTYIVTYRGQKFVEG